MRTLGTRIEAFEIPVFFGGKKHHLQVQKFKSVPVGANTCLERVRQLFWKSSESEDNFSYLGRFCASKTGFSTPFQKKAKF